MILFATHSWEGGHSIKHGAKLMLVGLILTLDALNAPIIGKVDELTSDISFLAWEVVLDGNGDGATLIVLDGLQFGDTTVGNVVVTNEGDKVF